MISTIGQKGGKESTQREMIMYLSFFPSSYPRSSWSSFMRNNRRKRQTKHRVVVVLCKKNHSFPLQKQNEWVVYYKVFLFLALIDSTGEQKHHIWKAYSPHKSDGKSREKTREKMILQLKMLAISLPPFHLSVPSSSFTILSLVHHWKGLSVSIEALTIAYKWLIQHARVESRAAGGNEHKP